MENSNSISLSDSTSFGVVEELLLLVLLLLLGFNLAFAAFATFAVEREGALTIMLRLNVRCRTEVYETLEMESRGK